MESTQSFLEHRNRTFWPTFDPSLTCFTAITCVYAHAINPRTVLYIEHTCLYVVLARKRYINGRLRYAHTKVAQKTHIRQQPPSLTPQCSLSEYIIRIAWMCHHTPKVTVTWLWQGWRRISEGAFFTIATPLTAPGLLLNWVRWAPGAATGFAPNANPLFTTAWNLVKRRRILWQIELAERSLFLGMERNKVMTFFKKKL